MLPHVKRPSRWNGTGRRLSTSEHKGDGRPTRILPHPPRYATPNTHIWKYTFPTDDQADVTTPTTYTNRARDIWPTSTRKDDVELRRQYHRIAHIIRQRFQSDPDGGGQAQSSAMMITSKLSACCTAPPPRLWTAGQQKTLRSSPSPSPEPLPLVV